MDPRVEVRKVLTTPKKMKAFFEESDTDKDGYLTMAELKAGMRKHGYNLSKDKLKKQFEMFDLNGDKKISRDEFLAAMGEVPEHVHEDAAIRKMFVAFDVNKDGTIDRVELRGVLASMKKQQTEAEVEKIMALVDADHNGRISYEEFVKFFSKGTS